MVPRPAARGLRRAFIASVFLAWPLLAGGAESRAQAPGEADVFTVDQVAVDATAQTAAQARETALARGQVEALRRLFARLTLRADEPNLPRPSAAETADLVQGIEVEGEKTSSVRYIADLRVRFRPDAVRNLLRARGVPFAETRSKPMLVLPVLETDAGPVLWEQVTPWREAWSAVPRGDGLVPLIVPVGDLGDLQAITADAAMAGDTVRLNTIASQYSAGDVVVAAATPVYDGESVTAVNVSLARFSAFGQDETLVETFSADANAAAEDVWRKAARGVAGSLEDNWKRGALIRYDSERSLTAVMPLAGLNDLVETRRRLANVGILRRAELLYLARGEAQFRLDFYGDERQLATALAQNDLVLEQQGIGWQLRPRGLAAPAMTQPSEPNASEPLPALSEPAPPASPLPASPPPTGPAGETVIIP